MNSELFEPKLVRESAARDCAGGGGLTRATPFVVQTGTHKWARCRGAHCNVNDVHFAVSNHCLVVAVAAAAEVLPKLGEGVRLAPRGLRTVTAKMKAPTF
eukprot:SAG11_NODE_16946_length_533_cov_0.711982_2_plen_99_part_01